MLINSLAQDLQIPYEGPSSYWLAWKGLRRTAGDSLPDAVSKKTPAGLVQGVVEQWSVEGANTVSPVRPH